MKPFNGFLNYYWDESTGKIWLQIDKLDQEILYQTSLPAGLGSNDIGLDRGVMGTTSVVKFNRVGNKVLMIEPNYSYRALSSDLAEKRAIEQSFAQSTLWGFVIAAEGSGSVLVDATDFIIRDALKVSNKLRALKQGSYNLDASRSAMYQPRTKNFPLNTEFEATLTFTNADGQTGSFVNSVTPSSEAITLRVHHTFAQLPDANFQTRLYDARSPYITNSYFDYSSPVNEPIQKNIILRHRLEKKDPNATKSEAVKPIVYYLDNGTPEPIRSALMEGASWWNQAFEAAGFINAFQVKILPEDADPMDLRYNMIHWVHRSTRGWSYGAAVVDPRTGEIIKGNVSLGSLRVRQDYLIAQGLLAPFENDALPKDDKMLKMALQRLKQLSAHEIGHTIGLMHNYISSAQNRASVMDYPPPMVTLNGKNEIDLSDAYTNEIGDWDKVSIQYGYTQFPKGTDEAQALNKILSDAAKSGLTFISDRDARDPAGMHPSAHLWDNGNNPVKELEKVMKVRAVALSNFGLNNIPKGTPMAMLEDVLVPVYLFHRYQVEAVSKLVGGMNYSYALKGDGQITTLPLSKNEQMDALKALASCMEPQFLTIPENIVKLIPPRPAGFDYTRELFNRRTGLNFDPLAAAETAADLPLSFLFNANRLNRMVQLQASNNGLGIDEMINLLIDKTWKSARLKGMEGLIQKQNEQLLLTYLLSASINENASFASKAQLLKALDTLKNYASEQLKLSKDENEKAYFLLSLDRMKNPEKAKPTLHQVAPPGAPIGCMMDEI
ncbi:zinc-dependent metalloprotease [Daejeonella sp.]|uniref:zinc-dependent metalloprotease n=1 Tax=Daejeonella sp. TaxID=2805397 RepID=UPI0025C0662A|nr:zinc-dependent metalloprotease [Daejeonella sp.]